MSVEVTRDVSNDAHWREFSHEWLLRSDSTYLNHGSFGPPPNYVRQRRREWIDQLDAQPMDFYVRQLEPALNAARSKTAAFVGTDVENLVFVENATFGMNVIADSLLHNVLKSGDEVLLTNHEYGAVHRIWDRVCQRSGVTKSIATLPEQFESAEQIVDCITSRISDKTRVVIVSHITSATALVMPIAQICSAIKQLRGELIVIVDGPHAPAQVELNIDSIGCDFYVASCHKWLCASLGSGFLFVAPRWHENIEPQLISWGRLQPAVPDKWHEEFGWSGTRDHSAYLSVADAIDYMTQQIGLDVFRERSQYLAKYAEEMLCEEFNTTPIGNRADGWYASMAHVPLPAGDFSKLQDELWNEYQIEIPVILFENKWYVRVSCHLYNNTKQLETLKFAIRKFLVS